MPNRGTENQPSYSAFACTVFTVGTGALPLTATTPGLVYLKAAVGNAAPVTLGGPSVTAGVGYVLAAGEVSPPICLESLAAVYAISSSSSQSLLIMVQS